MKTAYIGMGSNVGNRSETIQRALKLLDSHRTINTLKVSSLIETDPVGGPTAQPRFLNGAASIETLLEARELLSRLQDIESQLGRIRSVKWGPRTIDLDLLLYGLEIAEEDKLTIPHPRMHKRMFVLKPLMEIAPEVRHPVFNKTIRELFMELTKNGERRSDRSSHTGPQAKISREGGKQ